MRCPFCSTENRDERETCYHCNQDLSMLRLVVNKARHHYNLALEHADRGRYHEASTELQNALDLDRSLVQAHVVLGTVYSKLERFEEAEKCWQRALAINPSLDKAHQYLTNLGGSGQRVRSTHRLRLVVAALLVTTVGLIAAMIFHFLPARGTQELQEAWQSYLQDNNREAMVHLENVKAVASEPFTLRSADRLNQAIRKSEDDRAEAVQKAIAEEQWLEAHRLINAEMAHKPTAETEKQLNTLQALALNGIEKEMNKLFDACGNGDISYRQLSNLTKPYMIALARSENARQWESRMAELGANSKVSHLRNIKERYATEGDLPGTRMRVSQLLAEHPDFEDAKRFESDLASSEFNVLHARFGIALSASLYDRSEEYLGRIRALAERFPTPEFKELVRTDELSLAEAKLDARVRELSALNDLGQFENAQKLIATLDPGNLSGGLKAKFLEETADTRRGLAAGRFQEIEKQASALQLAQLSRDEIVALLGTLSSLAPIFTPQSDPYRSERMMFWRGLAQVRLQDSIAAGETLQELGREFPTSPFVALLADAIETVAPVEISQSAPPPEPPPIHIVQPSPQPSGEVVLTLPDVTPENATQSPAPPELSSGWWSRLFKGSSAGNAAQRGPWSAFPYFKGDRPNATDAIPEPPSI